VGTLEASEEVTVRAEVDARVRSVEFEEGAPVEAGALLVLLDDDEVRAEVAELEARARQVEARVEEDRRALERRRPLLEKRLVSEEEYRGQEMAVRAGEAALEAARASLRAARKRLEDHAIRAPLAGQAGERLVSPGDYLQTGNPVVPIYVSDLLEVSFRVPERHLDRLAPGQAVQVHVAAYPDDAFPGEVAFLDPSVDPLSRTVALKARLQNGSGLLRPGLFAHVDLVLAVRPDAVVVPEEAIVPREDGDWAFVVDDGTARRRRVRVGERMPGYVEVREGLVPGETVVTAGQRKLADGTAVRIIEDSPAPVEGGAATPGS
jgi:RND family efflux transporter MFP subunit